LESTIPDTIARDQPSHDLGARGAYPTGLTTNAADETTSAVIGIRVHGRIEFQDLRKTRNTSKLVEVPSRIEGDVQGCAATATSLLSAAIGW